MGAGGPAGQDGGGSKESNKKAKKDLEVSAYEREIEKQKEKERQQANVEIGLGESSNKKNQFTDLTKENLNPQEDNYQQNKLENYQIKDSDAPGVVGAILNLTKGARQKSFEVNRDYYQKNVVGKGDYKNTFEDYERYITGRSQGKLDAMGRTITQRDDGGNNQPAQETIIKKNIGGTEVQTTQAKIDEQRAKSDEYDVRKVKKEGRKRYTLTSSKGVTQVSDDYSLGKKSLLGTV
jgi:hypothetical protein